MCLCVFFLKTIQTKIYAQAQQTNKHKNHTNKYLKWTKMKFRIRLYFTDSIVGYRLQELLRCCFLNASSLHLYCHRILFYGMFCELYDPSLILSSPLYLTTAISFSTTLQWTPAFILFLMIKLPLVQDWGLHPCAALACTWVL